jgi:DNA-binding NtrC family response regulator
MFDVLLVDDDGELLQSLARAISSRVDPLRLSCSTAAHEAEAVVVRHRPRVVVLDLCLDERRGVESGFDLLTRCRAVDPSSRIIVLTGHGSLDHGVRALTLGAASFIEKPVEPEHLAAVIRDAATQAELRREYERLSCERVGAPTHGLIGESRSISRLRERISFVATTPQPVLILGETGTGKGLCARLIHERSTRRERRFVHYQPNYGGGDLAQSELFGHIKGAFTGATETRAGLALEADQGTLFVDELDEMPAEVQVRLLDLIQEQRVRAVGSDSYRKISCRIIAATNRPLEEALSIGKIRRDLYHRLAHNVLYIPPLRERLEDIPHLCHTFLRDMRTRELVQVFDLHPAVFSRLMHESWPGNVRQLQATIENAAYHAHYHHRSVITVEDLGHLASSKGAAEGQSFHSQVEAFKLRLIEDAVRDSDGSQVQAARSLGLDRGTLRRILSRAPSTEPKVY